MSDHAWNYQVFYYGIMATDKAGNQGRVSNLVPVFVAAPLPQPKTSESNSTAELVFKVVKNGGGPGVLSQDESNTMIYLVSAGITAFILILITLFVAAIVKNKNRQKQLRQQQNTQQGTGSKIKSISGPLMSGVAGSRHPNISSSLFPDDSCKQLPDVASSSGHVLGSSCPAETSVDVWTTMAAASADPNGSGVEGVAPRSLIHDCGLPSMPTRLIDSVSYQQQPASLMALSNFPSYSASLQHQLFTERAANSLVAVQTPSSSYHHPSTSPPSTSKNSYLKGGGDAGGAGGVKTSDCGTSSTECNESECSGSDGDCGNPGGNSVAGGHTNVYNVSTGARIVVTPSSSGGSSGSASIPTAAG